MRQKLRKLRLANETVRAIVIMALMILPLISWAETDMTTVFLARHAEKADSSRNPPLSEAGRSRATELARMLRDAGISQIHSTDYNRTRNTATPLAELLGLEIRIYDPTDLEALAARLVAEGGRHLVVGHSDTTPELAQVLGGEPGSEIDEPGEYDRLYVIGISDEGEVSTVMLRYGKPYEP